MVRKEDVFKMIDEWLERLDDDEEAIECILLMLKNRVENMPDAVVRGEWIPLYGTLEKFFKCGKCGDYSDFRTNFCHACGADMRKKVE